MCSKTQKKNVIRAILLLMGYGLLFPISIFAIQRNLISADSIAYTKMNREYMFGIKSHQKFLPKIVSLSSQLNERANNVLGKNEAFYVYENANSDGGFVIISADDRMPDVLAYSYDEVFNLNDMSPSTRYWLECYIDDYLSLDSISSMIEEAHLVQTDVNPEGVAPILGELPWGQNAPFNELCPMSSEGRCVVGCVATAMSQVMWLHQWPTCGKGNIDYTTRTHKIRVAMNLANQPIQWNLIKERYEKGKYTDLEANAIATLMAACGATVHMDYGPDGSGAYQEDILKALVANFNYDPDAAFLPREFFTSTDWHSLLVSELNEGRAVNYAGQSRTDGGHSFVIDGYDAGCEASNPYYHLNWGWNGRCNGYYTLPQLHPVEKGKYYVEEGFSNGQQMLIGIHPDDGLKGTNNLLCAEGLKVMQAILKPGEATTLKISTVTNLCYRTFKGEIGLRIEDQSGNAFVVGRIQVDAIPYLENQTNLAIPFVIPENLDEGNYLVKVVGIDDDKIQTAMYSRSTPEIIVSRNPYGEGTSFGTTMLCSSEFEVYKQADTDSLLNVRVYELFNYSDDLLEGDFQLEIAGDDGESIMTIGTSVWHPAIEPNMIESSPLTLMGAIPDTLCNGIYRIYVIFYPADRSIANRVKLFDPANLSKVPNEYYLPMIVADNEVVVNGVSFSRIISSIMPMVNSPSQKESFFSITGTHSNKDKGLMILKKSNGEIYKIISK